MNKNSAIVNMFWRFAESCGTQLVTFAVSVVLARILVPSDYGTITLVMVFVNILTIFVNGSLATSLIQKKNVDDLDYSTAFIFNITVAVIIYLLMFLLAPFISSFYEINALTSIIRVMSLSLIASAIKNVQLAYASRNMQFKKFFFASLFGTIGSAVGGIVMAYSGYGVWSLVFQQLFDAFADAIVLWFSVKWRPSFSFSIERFIGLFNYGYKIVISTIIDKIYLNLSSLIIGKVYTSADLAFYNKGNHLPDLLISNINVSIDSVLLPVMSNSQDEKEKVKELVRKSIKTSTYIIFPLMAGLIAVSHNFILLFYTEKWLPCVPYLCIFAISYMFQPINTASMNGIKAIGRSDIYLALEAIKKTLGLIVIILTMRISVIALVIGVLLTSLMSIIINVLPNKRLFGYSYIEQLEDIVPSLLLSITMCMIVYYIGTMNIAILPKLILQIVVGISIYVGFSKLLKFETFNYLFDILKKGVLKH